MAAQPEPWKSLSSRIYAIEEKVRALYNRSPFFGTGVHANGQQGLDSDNYVAGASGFSLRGGDGFLEINDVLIRGGIIGNDSLTNPVAPGVVSNETTGFGITTSSATKLSGSISVPAGFSSAAISVIARTFALDNDTVNPTDYLYSRVTLGGVSSSEVPLACTYNGGSGTSVSPLSVVLTSLGASIAYSVSAHSAFANWGTDALNRVSLSGSVLWFR